MGLLEEMLSHMISDRVNAMEDSDKLKVVKSVIMDRLPILYAHDITKMQGSIAYKAIEDWFKHNTLESNQTLVCTLTCQRTDLLTLYDKKYRECTCSLKAIDDLSLYKIVERIPAEPSVIYDHMGQKDLEFNEYFISKGPEKRIVYLNDANERGFRVLMKGDVAEYEYNKMGEQVEQFDELNARANTDPLIAYYFGKVMQEAEIEYAPFYTPEMVNITLLKYFDRKMSS